MTTDKKPTLELRWLIIIVLGCCLITAGGLALMLRDMFPALLPIETATATPTAAGTSGTATQSGGASTPQGAAYSMDVQLSEGQSQPQAYVPLPQANGDTLTPDEVAAILARLPALSSTDVEQVDFKLPTELLPPPRPGETIKEQFPPADTAVQPNVDESGPLQVLRYSPEGELPIAPFISVTFNQSMVPLGTLEDLSAQDVVQIDPPLPGTWRWLGTRTLTFEYDSELVDRLPKATEFHVTVPAGVKSVNGNTLSDAITWTFTTPPPRVVTSYPYDAPQPLEPLFFVAFDQRIDPAAVLATIDVSAGMRGTNLVLATDEEIKQDETISHLAENTPEGRWLAFKATQPFPADTRISVAIGPGTPSAEGPLVTQETQNFEFSTYAPLRIEEHGCYWYDSECRPLTPFNIRFNNPLDTEIFTEDMITVKPEIPGMVINPYGNSIEIRGETSGQTTYTVTVSSRVQDIFSQTLGHDERLTFKVGKSEPVLVGPGQNFLTLDPASVKPAFSVYAINYSKLHIRVNAVNPADWTSYKKFLQEWQRDDNPPALPGTKLLDETRTLKIPDDTLSQVDVDLTTYLKNGSGQFVIMVEPPKSLFETENDKWRRYSQTIFAWVQVTQIGLDAFSDYDQMLAWATSLKDGTPLNGVSIQAGNKTYTTGSDGTVRFDLPVGATYLVATLGSDTALLPNSTYYWDDSGWQSYPPNDTLRWYVFDDRKMYRPGEEVHIKGWVRKVGGRQDGDVSLPAGLQSISYQLYDPQGNSLVDGQVDANALGGFDFVITLPEATNLGQASLYLNASGSFGSVESTQFYHNIQIQEFRRPEFEVSARNETTGPYFINEHAILAVEANYYAGGSLPNADTTWQVTTSPSSYSPPNWPDFSFGTWQPWWYFYDYGYPGPGGGGITETFTGKTDASGTHYLRLDFTQQGDPDVNPRPQSIVAQATVMDVNRQAWASTTTLLVHPANLYIGLRSERYFVEKGKPLKVDYIVTDLDGNAISGKPVEITAARLEWKLRSGEWVEEEVDVQTCSGTSISEPDTCTFETPIGGSYRITAVVTDDQGRKNESSMTRWVSGGKRPTSRKVEQEEVTLIPDKETYQPGDTAQVLVQAPFSPAEGLLTVSRSGMLYTERFHIEDGTITLEIPIEDAYTPNLQIQVDLTGAASRTDDFGEILKDVPARPAFASGELTLNIPPLARTLELEVTPDEAALEPGGETNLSLSLTDANGAPIADAELAVVVVDEAILALTNYQLSDPISMFYSQRPALLSSLYGRANIVLVDPLALAQEASQSARAAENLAGSAGPQPTMMADMMMEAPAAAAPMEKSAAEGEAAAPIQVRSDFNPLANFSPTVRTSSNGEARVYIKLPDNLTRYRVMVVAVDNSGKRFGMGQANITARLPLMVRPSAPRFLNFGDKFELPIVLQNQTNAPMLVDVVARASNLELGEPGLRVNIPANDRVEVRFPASTQMAGTTQIQIAAVSGSYADAATVELPIYTPATTEAFATYGVIDDGAIAQPVLAPSNVFAQYGGLEVNTSSTALQALTDAVLYLTNYPFECSEQLASRILAVAALRDVLTAFEADGLPTPTEMENAVTRDIERLRGMQNYDGGFPYWRRGFDSSPFNTIHVAHALYRAEQKGFNVPVDMQQSVLVYLQNIEQYYPHWYSLRTRQTLSAYALYVRNLMGDRDAPKAEALIDEAGLENLSMEAVGWLWSVVDDSNKLDAIRRYVGNRVVETAGAANFTTDYDDQTYLLLSSDRRTDGILLDALMEDNPQSDLIPKLVNGLLAHRTKGHWGSTQDNVFVLLSLDRYFNTYETQTPDFVARIWLGDTYAGSSEFRGRTTERHETLIPMNYVLSETLSAGGTEDLILSKDGPGRLYYRLGLRYAPNDLNLEPLDMGFVVQRRYEAIDNPDDVTQDSDGVWHIKAGARVKVHITMVADNRRYHVALVDPLPAGLEIVNPALAVSGSVPQDPGDTSFKYGWWWWGPWYEHQNMRDSRAEAFTSLLWDGVYQYTYIARATTPGTFIAPPAKAEEMYSPEVFGRSGSDWVIVE